MEVQANRGISQCGRRDLNPHGPFGPPGPKPGASAGFRHARAIVFDSTSSHAEPSICRNGHWRAPAVRVYTLPGLCYNVPGPLAQLVVQGTLNPKVAGSSPARPTTHSAATDCTRLLGAASV